MTQSFHRRSVRLRGYDYGAPGSLFFTICTYERGLLFGEVRESQMHLSDAGEVAWREWHRTVEMRGEIVAHAFVVMPNHVHGLITVVPTELFAAMEERADCHLPLHERKRPHSLATIATGYKGAVTRAVRANTGIANQNVWQRGYHDRVVRSEQEFQTIFQYIEENPKRWAEDRFNPELGG